MRQIPIVPAFITQEADGRHHAWLYPPVFVEKTGNKKEEIQQTTQVLTKCVEEHIRQYPEEWFWLHNRWKHGEKTESLALHA